MDVLKIFLFVLSLSITTGCQLGYYTKSAYNQLALMNRREPIEKALKSDKLDEAQKNKLKLAQEARIFSEKELGLTPTKNYTSFVQLDQPYVTYVVSAAPKWELKHYIWSYLFVGDMPYKGYFKEADAREEEASLQKKGYDTYLRGVSAFSTLGWFQDPIFSSMLSYREYELVNTIIHETVHTTLYIKNNADFNERLAVFLGNKGMELFYLKKEGPDSPTLKLAQDESADDNLVSKFISKEIEDLRVWYTEQKEKDESVREARLRQIQDRFAKQVQPNLKTKSYDNFVKTQLNNARLMVFKTYMQNLEDFEKLYEKVGRDFHRFLEESKKLEKEKDPEQKLKDLVSDN